jgi:hypothetical protein
MAELITYIRSFLRDIDPSSPVDCVSINGGYETRLLGERSSEIRNHIPEQSEDDPTPVVDPVVQQQINYYTSVGQRFLKACADNSVTPLFVDDPTDPMETFGTMTLEEIKWFKQHQPRELRDGVVFRCSNVQEAVNIIVMMWNLDYCQIHGIMRLRVIDVDGKKILSVRLDAESG